ncbi:hypothetical protein [Porphyromonas endodontalis]
MQVLLLVIQRKGDLLRLLVNYRLLQRKLILMNAIYHGLEQGWALG